MRFPCLLTLGLLGLLAPAAAAQDPVQLGRLASEQRLVAEQVRRLAKLLETLEQRDRAEGREARAELLAQAGERLRSVEQGAELASVIESIAGDLAALRTGDALSAQAGAIQVLEQLLEMLLETQMVAEQEQRMVDLEEHVRELEELRQRQENLRRMNEALQKSAAQKDAAGEPSPGEQALMEVLQKELESLAAQQRKLAEEIAKLGVDRRSPKAAEAAEHAQEAAEQLDQAAGTEPKPGAQPPAQQPPAMTAQQKLESLAAQQRKLAEEIAKLGAESRSEQAAQAAEQANQAAEQLEQAASKEAKPGEQPAQPSGKPAGQPQQPAGQPPSPGQESTPQAVQKQMESLAAQQRKLAEEIAQLEAERPSPEAAAAAEHAQEAAEELEEAAGKKPEPGHEQQSPPGQQQPGQQQPGQQQSGQPQPAQPGQQPSPQPPGQQPPPPQNQEQQQQQAAEQQKQTEEALREAIKQAQQELEQLQNRKRMQELEDVRVLAEQILSAHRAEEETLQELVTARAESLTRAQRARLRQSARTEQDLGAATQNLLVKIETLGASTFPFFLHSIEVDHQRLAAEIGPPRLAVDDHALQIAGDLTLNWETLIEAIRTEQERIRRKMEAMKGEQEPGEGEGQESEESESPLVDFAMELQLLKRMQSSLARDLDWTRKKFESYARAGITPDAAEDLLLQTLLERQLELRRQFEDMLARMQGAGGTGDEGQLFGEGL